MKSSEQIAEEWGLSKITINDLCNKGKIQGAVKEGRKWLIPDDAIRPADGCVSSGTAPMFPTINLKETGINIRRIMDKRGIEPKDVQKYLNLASAQSVYNWCNGTNMPTIDNLYALSQLLQVPIDGLVCGNRKAILPKTVVVLEDRREKRLYAYYKRIYEMAVA